MDKKITVILNEKDIQFLIDSCAMNLNDECYECSLKPFVGHIGAINAQ